MTNEMGEDILARRRRPEQAEHVKADRRDGWSVPGTAKPLFAERLTIAAAARLEPLAVVASGVRRRRRLLLTVGSLMEN